MNSFNKEKADLPISSVWLMNAISEYKGKQELYAHQSPQILKALVEMALIESAESSNRTGSLGVEFSISDIERACPNVSRVMIKKVLLRQQKDKKIKCLGKGHSAKWERMVY